MDSNMYTSQVVVTYFPHYTGFTTQQRVLVDLQMDIFHINMC